MRILAVSDREEPRLKEHFDPHRWAGVDAIISCGDLQPDYLTYLRKKLEAPLFYVKGNHDRSYRTNPPVGAVNLHGRLTRIGDFRVLGLEGSMRYNHTRLQYTEGQMMWKIVTLYPHIWLAGGVDIIVSHAPPAGIYANTGHCHQGFESFRRLIKTCRPRLFLHGHIHLNYGMGRERETMIGKTRVLNCHGYQIIQL